MVGRRGLKSATDEQTLELSVVCCDLRGFTAFTAATSSQKVIAILREYYDAVGAAATECGGTIKDQAGDGVLILVGAPIPYPDHAQRALRLARQIRERGMQITARWSDAETAPGRRRGRGKRLRDGRRDRRRLAPGIHRGRPGREPRLAPVLGGRARRSPGRRAHHRPAERGRAAHQLRPGLLLQLKGFQQPVQSYTSVVAA